MAVAGWPIRKNDASGARVVFPIYDADGDLVTGATSPDSEVSKDEGTFTDVTAEATEVATSSGVYYLDLSQAEINADRVATITKSGTGKTAVNVIYTSTRNIDDLAYPTTTGRAIDVTATGEVGLDLDNTSGAIAAAQLAADCITSAKIADDAIAAEHIATGAIVAATFAAGAIDASAIAADAIGASEIANAAIDAATFAAGAIDASAIANAAIDAATFAASAITSTVLADDAITAAKIANNAIGATEIADAAIDAATFAAGAIDATAIAADAIDASALKADAVTEIRSLVTGTADSGSTTTIVDTERNEADTDYWKGAWLLVTSGTATNQVRLITGFNAGTDTLTFAPALTQAITTNTYEILPAGSVDVRLWAGSAPNALVSGAVDADVSALQGDVITAAAIANAAIDAATFAAGAIDATAIANAAIDAATFAAGAIDASAIAADAIGASEIADAAIDAATFAAGAIDASAIAADAIGSSELAATAATEIAEAVFELDVDAVEGTAPVHSLTTAVLKAVSKVEDDAGTLKTYRTNGSTVHMSQTIATDSGLDPIDSLTVGT